MGAKIDCVLGWVVVGEERQSQQTSRALDRKRRPNRIRIGIMTVGVVLIRSIRILNYSKAVPVYRLNGVQRQDMETGFGLISILIVRDQDESQRRR